MTESKKLGRPRSGTIYDSNKAFQVGEGIDLAMARWAKGQGCKAFRAGGRVSAEEFHRWWKRHGHKFKGTTPNERKRILECELLMERIEQLRFQKDVERRKYVLWENVRIVWTGYAEDLKRLLREKYEDQLPPKQEGLRAPQLAAMAREVNTEIIQRLRGDQIR